MDKKASLKNKSERQIEIEICYYLKSKRIVHWKNEIGGFFDTKRQIFRKNTHPFFRRGVSDILGILPGGRFLAIEVKSKTGKASIEQLSFLDDINRHGGIAILARSVLDVELVIENILK